jgi:aryl-alcohol dehydrogenase-like predicted oxidoreductase
MHTARLAANGPVVSAMGLGCMGMIAGYGPIEREESLTVLRSALELGVGFWDTADAYGLGRGEELLAEALAAAPREEVVLATKFGGIFDPHTGAPTGVRGDAAYVREACEASLRRLGTDHIDLYYQHLPDPDTPVEETMQALAELAAAGKIRHIGLSNLNAGQLRRAHTVHPVAAVQAEWSVFSRDAEQSLLPTCRELGIGVVAYSPLSRGFLTGAYTSRNGLAPDDARHMFPRFSAENAAHNATLVQPLREVAERHGATPAQVALAWVTHQAEHHRLAVVPIPGTKKPQRLRENVAALDIRLTDHDLAALDPIASQVQGSRVAELPPELRRFMPAES